MLLTVNYFLVIGSILSATVALLHFACIFKCATWFQFLGAGEPVVHMAMKGHWYPYFVSIAIGTLLSIWAFYVLSGAGVLIKLPYARMVLVGIIAIYILRAVLFPLLKPAFPGNSETFWLVSSLISLIIGVIHFIGLRQVWTQL